MKNRRKLGLGLLLSLVATLSILGAPRHAFADFMNTPVTSGSLNLSFKDRSTISGTVNGVSVTYVDNGPTDTTYQYVISASGIFCPGSAPSNITILNNDIALGGGGSKVSARFDATVSKDATKGGCSGQKGTSINFDVGNPGAGMNLLSWQSSGNLQIVGGASLTEIAATPDLYESDTNGSCGGGTVAVVNGSGATIYSLQSTPSRPQPGSNPLPASSFPDLANTSLASGCSVNNINERKGGVSNSTQNYLDLAKQTYGIAGTRPPVNTGAVGTGGTCTAGSPGCTCTGNPGTGLVCTTTGTVTPTPTGGGDTEATCEQNAGSSSLSWLMCPVMTAASDFTDKMTNTFESQLSFSVSQDVRNNDGQAKVKNSWTLIKNLASSLVVIIILIMIISQAIGQGPFDAYTIRKMLPRLVIAVIIMQISWPLFTWVVDVFDHIGTGLAGILYAPFGGKQNLDLGSLMTNAQISNGQAVAINWVGLLLILPILGSAALPALMSFAVVAAMALLVALITLIFRKILIIMALILAPIALLAWILPGTQKYWKLWQDNFIKALAMYPLAVAIIAGGRIFAYVVGTQDNGGGKFFSLLLVLVGFFGPLFILPKTFKWGGGIMSMVGNNLTSTFKPGTDKVAAGARGIGERWQGRRAKMYNPGGKMFGMEATTRKIPFRKKPITYKTPGGRFIRRVQSGHVVPFSKRSQRLAIQAGDKWSTEEDEMARALLKRKGEKAMPGYKTRLRDEDGNLQKYSRNAAGQMLTEDGQVTDDTEKALKVRAGSVDELHADDVKVLNGVAAMKQVWVDLMETGTEQEKKMAARELTATSSWPEIQTSFTPEGKRATEYDEWGKSITTSPEDYPRVLRSRVDQTPHVKDGAYKRAAGIAAERGIAASDIESYLKNHPSGRDLLSAEQLYYGIHDQASNEDFSTQADGFWQEGNRVSMMKDAKGDKFINPDTGQLELTPEGHKLHDALVERFTAIQQAGPTARQQMLSHMADGGNLQNWLGEMGINITGYLKNPGDEPLEIPRLTKEQRQASQPAGSETPGQAPDAPGAQPQRPAAEPAAAPGAQPQRPAAAPATTTTPGGGTTVIRGTSGDAPQVVVQLDHHALGETMASAVREGIRTAHAEGYPMTTPPPPPAPPGAPSEERPTEEDEEHRP